MHRNERSLTLAREKDADFIGFIFLYFLCFLLFYHFMIGKDGIDRPAFIESPLVIYVKQAR